MPCGSLLYIEREKSRYVVHQLTGTERIKHDLIGKLTAIVAHCDLIELKPDSSPESKERLEKIKALALDSAEMVLMCAATVRHDSAEELQELFV